MKKGRLESRRWKKERELEWRRRRDDRRR